MQVPPVHQPKGGRPQQMGACPSTEHLLRQKHLAEAAEIIPGPWRAPAGTTRHVFFIHFLVHVHIRHTFSESDCAAGTLLGRVSGKETVQTT